MAAFMPVQTHAQEEPARLPCPVLMVHNLAGDASIWSEFVDLMTTDWGWSDGGQLEYCLNSDGSNATSTLSEVLPFTDLPMAYADVFSNNFECSPNGTCYNTFAANGDGVFSGQAAAAKQGLAIADAVLEILQATGEDRLVLVAHSMGGLAIREYLQTPEYWPPSDLSDPSSPPHHHIAKVITSGTPHAGSNFSVGWLEDLGDIFGGDIEQRSDAVRDLRTSYSYSGDSGVFLFGGEESDATMWDFLFLDFWNVDVNCDGDENDTIIGLNERPLPTDIEYALITSYDDLIVSAYSSDALVSLYDPPFRERFFVNGIFHLDLPDAHYYTLCALDEPDQSATAYGIVPEQTYLAALSPQGTDASQPADRDVYRVTLDAAAAMTLDTEWLPEDATFGWHTDGVFTPWPEATETTPVSSFELGAGTHYFQIEATVVDIVQGYSFTLHATPNTPSCPGDLNGDGLVSTLDVLISLSDFGCVVSNPGDCTADIDGDGIVTVADLLAILGVFGLPC
ncbi:MAG: hypothetical protein P8M07_00235 [Flavobacteriales bacterium]|nr:hypothetical protein [Flavobacteriales bacterium]